MKERGQLYEVVHKLFEYAEARFTVAASGGRKKSLILACRQAG